MCAHTFVYFCTSLHVEHFEMFKNCKILNIKGTCCKYMDTIVSECPGVGIWKKSATTSPFNN